MANSSSKAAPTTIYFHDIGPSGCYAADAEVATSDAAGTVVNEDLLTTVREHYSGTALPVMNDNASVNGTRTAELAGCGARV